MFCQSCGHETSSVARFCAECGASLTSAGDQGIEMVGGSIYGGAIQAGRDVYYNHEAAPKGPELEPKWSWQSPATTALLAWVSFGLGVIGVVAGWQGIEATLDALHGGPLAHELAWLIGFGITVCLLVLTVSLFLVAKNRTMHFLGGSLLPALTGWGGRIGIARLSGKCTICGGRLRFYNKPIRWIEYSNGRRDVTARTMAAECRRNPDHWWTVDPTLGSADA